MYCSSKKTLVGKSENIFPLNDSSAEILYTLDVSQHLIGIKFSLDVNTLVTKHLSTHRLTNR